MGELEILSLLNTYGIYVVFGVVLFEYLNFPVLPSGVIYPTIGVWVATSNVSPILVLAISILAGGLGSLILYLVGLYGGKAYKAKLYNKFPKIAARLLPYEEKMMKHAGFTVFSTRLLPVVRTLIGFPAGVMQIEIGKYLLCSMAGISIYNCVLIFSGTIVGDYFL